MLVSEESYTTFNPMLAEVVGAAVFPEHVVAPIREMLPKTRFIMGQVQRVNTLQRSVRCATLADFIRSALRYYPCIRAGETAVTLLHDGQQLLPELPARLGQAAARSLIQRGVAVHLMLMPTWGRKLRIWVEWSWGMVFPVDKWYAILAINLSAGFHTTRLALPAMKRRGWGRIVNIASAHALVASRYKSAYVTAKHGVAGFTKTVALEVAEAGITVNAVCPGYVLTPLVEQQIPDTARARGITPEEVVRDVLLAAQPTKKFVTVEQVAAFTAFLCSDDGASITGAVLPIEGGWTAQ